MKFCRFPKSWAADANNVNAGLGAGVPEGVAEFEGVLVAVLEELEVILVDDDNVAVEVEVIVIEGVRELVGVTVGVILGGITNSACTATPELTIE